jgi:hypothetical protein
MWVTTYFNNNGIPATGLSPIVNIRNIKDGSLAAAGSMSELGDGFYTYDFSNYDITEDYSIICDALSLPDKFRYKFLATGEYGDIINTINLINDNIEIRTLVIRKILTNRLELADGDTDNWVLYDDDSNTQLITWSVTDKNDDFIEEEPHTNTKRSKGI